MSTFLEKILETKRQEVEKLRALALSQKLDQKLRELPPCRGFARAIASGPDLSVIAEVKQASPSKGRIAQHFDPVATARTYEQAGAGAISVLTDKTYFQGSIEDLSAVRKAVSIPVLRKDFLIDEEQISEARLAGADAVLLICAALPAARLAELSAYAKSIGLDVLIEVHKLDELEASLAAGPSVLGINNRNLHSFEVSLDTTCNIVKHVPEGVLVIAESGIHEAADAISMVRCRARGVLVGESLMKAGTPEQVAAKLASFRVPLPTGDASQAVLPS